MKRFLLLIAFVVPSLLSYAQISVDLSQYQLAQNVALKCLIKDAGSGEALPYSTVYLIPQDDTTITHFTLSNEAGSVRIENIIPGKYELNIELIGYKPFSKVYELYGKEKDLGVIKLEENPEYIDAATITALGNPVSVKKDTIEYNATAFRVGKNAMLEDLLKKMPGMEVDSEGTVKVNGEKIDKITVGGKTFFFNDPTMAVRNLPARIVEKIKVVDKKKEDAEFSGVATKDDKEKVMDVQLKEEYRNGWFGNVRLAGGASLVPDGDREMMGQPGLLFNGSSMAAGYNDLDQITFLGSGKNVDRPGQSSTLVYDFDTVDTDDLASRQGLETSAQAGANYNTARIKGFDSNLSVNYSFNRKDAREKSSRTSFRHSEPDIITDGEYSGYGDNHRINAAAELTKTDDSKFLVLVRPTFSYTSQDRETSISSETVSSDGTMNGSVSRNDSHNDLFIANTVYSFGVKNLGKERRSLTLGGNYHYRGIIGNSSELSVTDYSTHIDRRHLLFDNKNTRHALEGILTYVEPITETWSFQGRVTGCYIGSRATKDAFNGDDGSVNDYYSSISNNDDWLVRERVLFQWEKESISVLFGLQFDQEENVTFSRSLGKESTIGKGKWAFNWAPYAQVEWNKENTSLEFDYGGYSDNPTGAQISPALDINNPVQMTAGNIYLRPVFWHIGSLTFNHSNPSKYSFLNVELYTNWFSNEIVYASWFDPDGNRYAIPVNSARPSFASYLYGDYRIPLDKQKRFTFSITGYFSNSSNTSYQAKAQLPGLDKDHFNYDEMMARFWGDADGNLFYSGASGFAESRTNTFVYYIAPSFEYKLDVFSAELGVCARNNITLYSLNPNANVNAWKFDLNAEMLYSSPKGWEFETKAKYYFYRGYSPGYGEPEFIWDASISKQIKAFTISLNVNDILNQKRSLLRSAAEDYVQDVYRNVMGRFFLVGVLFNFGKMNADNNRRAQNAIMNMMN